MWCETKCWLWNLSGSAVGVQWHFLQFLCLIIFIIKCWDKSWRRTCYKKTECHLSIAFIEKPTRNKPGREKQFYLWGKLCTMLWSFYYILSNREKYLCDKFRLGQFIDLIILHYYFWYATHCTSHLLDPHHIIENNRWKK